jgi:haloalkane dehalogenase
MGLKQGVTMTTSTLSVPSPSTTVGEQLISSLLRLLLLGKPRVYKAVNWPELPWASKYVEVEPGVRMHYIEAGDPNGTPILLLNGIPVWLYTWRNVIPELAGPGYRIIAVDFIGFGKSDKRPDIDPETAYAVAAQTRYLTRFIEHLDLKDLTLVLQDLGSVAGLDFARKHTERVAKLVLAEAVLPPLQPFTPDKYHYFAQPFREVFRLILTDPVAREKLVLDKNMFIEVMVPQAAKRKLSRQDKDAYRAPHPTPEDRIPILWGGPMNYILPESLEIIRGYMKWLEKTQLPVLLIEATPGTVTIAESVKWARKHIAHLDVVSIGKGHHFLQEDHPVALARAIKAFVSPAQTAAR